MATMNISLPDPMKGWVEAQVDSGKYANHSDYVRDLIRRDQSICDEREMLASVLTDGEKSGVSKKSVGDIFEGVKKRRKNEV